MKNIIDTKRIRLEWSDPTPTFEDFEIDINTPKEIILKCIRISLRIGFNECGFFRRLLIKKGYSCEFSLNTRIEVYDFNKDIN